MNRDRLREIIGRFPACRVAVLGDFFLDKYVEVDPRLAEVSLETGKTAHQVVSVRCSPGAAGTVVNNLAALGAGTIHALGLTGDDGEGYDLRKGLERQRCDVSGLLAVPNRFTPTYLKPRDCGIPQLSGEHERYDTKNRTPTPAAVQEAVLARLGRLLPELDAVIVLDQVDEAESGIVTTRVRDETGRLAAANPRIVFWGDSRARIGQFRGMIIKVNAREAVREAFGSAPDAENDEVVRAASAQLGKATGRPVFVTAGERGIWVGEPEAVLVPGVRVEGPTDPTGAGDSATAGAVLALCSGGSPGEAAVLANLVASITIQQLATTGTASPPELEPRLELWRRQNRLDQV